MADRVKLPMIREDGMYVGVDGSVKDPRAACPKMERILAKKQKKLAQKNAVGHGRSSEGGLAIMSEIDYEAERYSLCIVHASQGGTRTYYKFYRVADFLPEDNPEELVPAIVQEHATSLEEAQANPDHLYNPLAARYYDERVSDFYFFQWRLDPNDFGKQLTRSFYDDSTLLDIKEPREVFIPNGVKNERDLRRVFSDGIPFEGKTTSVFYVVYSRGAGDAYQAVRCEREDFSFANGVMRLRSSIANPRESALSAPKVLLKSYDIIESPHQGTSFRCVYAKLGEVETVGNILLRPLDYYAADYVKWFIGNESIHATRADRKRISQIIDTALSRPNALETYLQAEVPIDEVEKLKQAISATVDGGGDEAAKLLASALLRDDEFRRRYIDQAARESDGVLETKKREINRAETRLEELEASTQSLSKQIGDLERRRDQARSEADNLAKEIADMSEGREKIFEELQSNISLKLGLRAASFSTGSAAQGASFEAGHVVEASPMEGSPFDILANNMKRLGIVSVFGESSRERSLVSRGVLGAMSATKMLAIPQPMARQIADALCIALVGRTADRITVPSDCRNISEVMQMVSSSDGVVLVENVIDSVNEGILFSLMSEDVDAVVVLPFVSHASASLVAKEAWGKVFLPSVANLSVYPRPKMAVKLQKFADRYRPLNVSMDDAIDVAQTIYAEVPDLNLPAQTLMLTAVIFTAMEELAEEEPTEPFVSQHLLISAEPNEDCFKILDEWSPEDAGLSELALRLVGHGV